MDDIAQVSLAAMESALTHLQEANKRLARLLALSWIIIAFIVGAALYFFTNYDFSTESVAIDSHQGAANYIGNDGDIINGDDKMQLDERTKETLRRFIETA